MLVTWWTRVSPPNFVMLFGLAMPRIVGGVQVSVGRANRLMSQVIAHVAQIHTVIGHVGTGRVPQPVGRGLFNALSFRFLIAAACPKDRKSTRLHASH